MCTFSLLLFICIIYIGTQLDQHFQWEVRIVQVEITEFPPEKSIPQIQLVTPPQKNNLVLFLCPRQQAKERFEKLQLQGCVTRTTSASTQSSRLERFLFLYKNVRNMCKMPVWISYHLKLCLQMSCFVNPPFVNPVQSLVLYLLSCTTQRSIKSSQLLDIFAL